MKAIGRTTWIVAVLGLHGFASDAHSPAPFDGVASAAALITVRNLQLIQAEPDKPAGRRWFVWDQGRGEGQTAEIALCGTSGTCEWTHIRTDAYAPSIRSMRSWSSTRISIFLVIYSHGAEAETAILVGLRPHGQPVILDQHDGAAIAASRDGTSLEVEPDSGAHPSRYCLDWSKTSLKLQESPCEIN